ncbi:MAG: hypothetical protein NXH85_04040 [Pseudomonadaceae bacterium]|nr:hypothetical protein [Pseudomonadaceae bacterium]
MRFVIYGAGGVGGTIGARLHMAGYDVVLIARGEHGEVLRERGMTFITAEATTQLRIDTVGRPEEISWRDDDCVLMCMKSQHMTGALEDLALVAPPSIAVVCAQNSVANERMALRRFANVYAMLIYLPASFLTPGEIVTDAVDCGGILDTGRYPSGIDACCEELTTALTKAGFSALPDVAVMAQKHGKLLANLTNIVQAASGRVDGWQPIARQMRREALACFAAAGIDCVDKEQIVNRHENTYRVVDVPGHTRNGGSSWQSIARGTGDIETDYLNGEIVMLGRLHGVPTPANAVAQQMAQRMLRERLPVGAIGIDEWQPLIDAYAKRQAE